MSAIGEDFAVVAVAAEKGRAVSTSSSSLEENDDNVEKATSGRRGSRGHEEKEQKETVVAGDHDDPVTVVIVAEVVRDEQQVAVAVTAGRDGERFAPSFEILVDTSSSDEGEKGEGEVVVGSGDHKDNIVDDEEVEETVGGAAAVQVVVTGEGEEGNEQEEAAEVGATANAAVRIAAPTRNEAGEVAAAVTSLPNNRGDEQIVVAMEVEPAAAVAAPENEEAAIGEGVEAVYVSPLGRGSKINGKKQKYRNGTSITMQFEDDW